MRESPFGVRLWRLLAQRRPTFDTSTEKMWTVLARDAGVPSGQLATVINEHVVPDPDLLRKLAPALGVHTADLFVVAGLPVIHELASAWPTSPWDVGSIVRHAVRMGQDQRAELESVVRSLPVQPRTEPAPGDDLPDTPGALLLRLLRNRNIHSYNAQILKAVGDGPSVSDSTGAGLGPRTVVITPRYVTAFAYLLGYTPSDMVALTGVGPVAEDLAVPAHRHARQA